MPEKPDKINILGIEYAVIYVTRPSDVNRDGRVALWGEIDFWTRTIRILDDGRPIQDIWHTILHETLHGIASALHISKLTADDAEETVDLLALALVDTFVRNGWFRSG